MPERVCELIEWLKEKHAEVPEDNRGEHYLEITGEDSGVEIRYYREQTEEEAAKAQAEQKQREETWVKNLEQQAARYGKKLVDA